MKLQSLRPKAGADLEQLRVLLDGGWRAGVPAALSDDVLLALGRDFRLVEHSFANEPVDGEKETSLAPAIYVTMNLLLQHPARAVANAELSLSEQGLMRSLHLYQFALERELVGRIIGVARPDTTAPLLEGLQRCLLE